MYSKKKAMPPKIMRKRSSNDGFPSIKAKNSSEEKEPRRGRSFFDGDVSSGASPSNLEIGDTDDAETWSNMQVRHSQEVGDISLIERGLNFARSTQFFVMAAALIFLLIVALLTTTSSKTTTVAPIYGEAYLTTNEFAGIRVAKPNEAVLITGGLGFIGSHVVDLLLHRGFRVTILDDESNGHNHNQFATEMVPHDITVVGDLPEIGNGSSFTHVIHLAAAISVAESMNNPDKYENVNYGGSEKVFNWIRNYNEQASQSDAATFIHKVTAASSAAVYGDPDDPTLLPLSESAPYGGKSPYADTKYRMEGLMREFVAKQNADSGPKASAVALRFFNVFGPRQDPKNPYSGVISLFLEAAQHDKDITVLGDGEMTRDFVYVKDVARAIVMSLLQETVDDKATFDNFNVCTGKSITINTLASQVKHNMQSSSQIKRLNPRDGDIRDSRCNPEKAAKGMAFTSAMSQEEGLEKTASWFREQSKV